MPTPVKKLIQALTRLPGVGDKSALRFALHLVLEHPAALEQLAAALRDAKEGLCACVECGNIAEREAAASRPERGATPPELPPETRSGAARGSALPDAPTSGPRCSICADPRRDQTLLCVVARIQDLLAIERSGAMRGRYFVLGRLLSPLDGVGPDELPLEALRARIRQGVEELVVATPPSVDGEATALHLAQQLAGEVRVTRIASGVPHGGDLEFADAVTLGRAMSGRRALGD